VLVLGAWGCGVFGNDSSQIAGMFAESLGAGIGACFDHVTFAVFDPSPDQATYAAFRERLAGGGSEAPRAMRGET
jgi:uncharacterized protein (TIGR02452 family)